jgi:hypothetical protein
MGYRELSRMKIVEVVRRWQMGESQRAIARAGGVARETVSKYLRAAEGLCVAGPVLRVLVGAAAWARSAATFTRLQRRLAARAP